MVALLDRGFNVQDLFLADHVTEAIPPFTKGKTHITKVQVERAKTISSRARIHIERAAGHLKEFKLLSNDLLLNMQLHLADFIWIIAGAITNLQPPLVIIIYWQRLSAGHLHVQCSISTEISKQNQLNEAKLCWKY